MHIRSDPLDHKSEWYISSQELILALRTGLESLLTTFKLTISGTTV